MQGFPPVVLSSRLSCVVGSNLKIYLFINKLNKLAKILILKRRSVT
jgi:hypothetical protein